MTPARRLASLAAASLLGAAPAALAGTPDLLAPLASPGTYSLAPAAPAAPLVAGGEASTFVGSRGAHGGAVQLQSGLLGGGTRAFLSAGAGQGPRWHGLPALRGDSVSGGLETLIAPHTTLSVGASYGQERFGRP